MKKSTEKNETRLTVPTVDSLFPFEKSYFLIFELTIDRFVINLEFFDISEINIFITIFNHTLYPLRKGIQKRT